MEKSDKIDRIGKIGKKRRFEFMCKACELGKIIANICIDQQLEINTAKLQKLLVLMHGLHLKIYNKELFSEKVVIWDCGVAIKEVDSQFREFGGGFTTKLPSQLAVLRTEETVIKQVLSTFGKKDVFEINKDPRLALLKDKHYEEGKSIVVDNNEIRTVFMVYDL